ncbi:MAG: hypothetical protein IH944_13290 [Armatimonadetes bacterium]|nr:hypothetical protein [Armatimonadota bacterium]
MTFAQAFAIEQIDKTTTKTFLGGLKVQYFAVRSLACIAFGIGAELAITFKSEEEAFFATFLVRPEKVDAVRGFLSKVANEQIAELLPGVGSSVELVMKLESVKWVRNGHAEDWMTFDPKAKLSREEGIHVVLEHAMNGVATGLYHPTEWRRLAALDSEEAKEISRAAPEILSKSEAEDLQHAPDEFMTAFLDFCDRLHPEQAVLLRSVQRSV